MKKLSGTMVAIMVATIVGTFITANSSPAGVKAKDGRFIAYDNGTVLDTKTNLMWAASDNGSIINWPDAEFYCENYRGGGYKDWRMPTLDELAELYDETKTYKSDCGDGRDLHLTALIHLRCGWVWSSDTRGSTAAYFIFYNGQDKWSSQSDVTYNFRALPVRSIQYDSVLPCPDGTEWNPDVKKCEPNKNIKKREKYKDGEDGVSRARPVN